MNPVQAIQLFEALSVPLLVVQTPRMKFIRNCIKLVSEAYVTISGSGT